MKKKIIFFDADGTLWYPKKTKHKEKPWWIYRDKRIKNHVKHLELKPTVLATLKKLKKRGIILIVLSTHPHPPKEADGLIKEKIKHFKLDRLFEEVHATRVDPRSKGKIIIKILKRRNIPKSKALMIGDSYRWDYKSSIEYGIDALLIETLYEKEMYPTSKRVKKTIKKIKDILKYV